MTPSTGYSTPLLETLISFIFGAFKMGCSWNFLAGFPAKWPMSLRLLTSKRGRHGNLVRRERDAGVLAEHLGCSSILVAMNLVLFYTCANMFTSFFLQGIWGGPWMWISHDGGYQLQSTIWPLRPSKESKSIKTPGNMGVSENSVPLNPMVKKIIIPMKNGYFIGNIPNIFRQTHIEDDWSIRVLQWNQDSSVGFHDSSDYACCILTTSYNYSIGYKPTCNYGLLQWLWLTN